VKNMGSELLPGRMHKDDGYYTKVDVYVGVDLPGYLVGW